MLIKSHWAIRVFLFACMTVVMSCAIRSMPDYEKNPPLAQVSGELTFPALQSRVVVDRDKYGVPHIFADNEHDLFFADGYVQAQDRLWEIVLFRALASGKLCEIFGNIGIPGQSVMGLSISTLEMDKRQRAMGMNYIGQVGEVMLAKTHPRLLAQMQAYCDGINAYLNQNRKNLPIEFQVLYLDPEPFRPADVISLSRFLAFMLGANMDMELVRYAVAKKYGEDVMWKLFPAHEFPGPTVVPKEMLPNRLKEPKGPPPGERPDPALASSLSAEAAFRIAELNKAARDASLFPDNFASNNWVVSPKITATKTAMLANDPHLLHIKPSIVYVMQLKGAGIDAYGVAFPGQPYIVMGHTRKLSWGATVTMADVQDLFIETVDKGHPGKYLYKGEWKDFIIRKEKIRIRPGLVQTGPTKRFKEEEITIRHTIHGPVLNDALTGLPKGTPPLALRWTGWDFSRDPRMFEYFITSKNIPDFMDKLDKADLKEIQPTNVGEMFDILMRGQSINDFIKAQEKNEILNMNWIAADADGHIAYLPGGFVPIRKKGTGMMPVPGEKGEYDWVGFIPLMETPHAIDPERGYMASANNEVVNAQWYPYIFGSNYDDNWRAWRIEELIQKLQPLTVDKMRRIQNDVYVKQAEIFVPLILKAVESKKVTDKKLLKAVKILREWNYEATIDSAGTSIFYETMGKLTDRVLKDDFDKKTYDKFIKGNAEQIVQVWVMKGQSEFFDDKRTPNKKEDVNDVLVGALEDAVKSLEKTMGSDMQNWQWGKIHTIKWYHPMGFAALKDLSIGPYPQPGGANTIRNARGVQIGKGYKTFEGPVMRHIMDMGDPDNALFVIDGAESGQWLSPHYRDLQSLWYNSQYMTAEMRPDKIKEQAESELILKP